MLHHTGHTQSIYKPTDSADLSLKSTGDAPALLTNNADIISGFVTNTLVQLLRML
jgi:hypothetical protein